MRHISILVGDSKVMSKLLEKPSVRDQLNAPDSRKNVPLHLCSNGEVARLLIESNMGAQLELKNERG